MTVENGNGANSGNAAGNTGSASASSAVGDAATGDAAGSAGGAGKETAGAAESGGGTESKSSVQSSGPASARISSRAAKADRAATAAAESAGQKQDPAVIVAPAYTPNLNYKVKGQEKKFPDWAQPLVKDEGFEKELRTTFEKADGFDVVKADRDQLQQVVQEQFLPMQQNLQTAGHFIAQKDYDSLFEVAGIDPRDVIQWAINYASQTPEQRTAARAAKTQEYQQHNQVQEVQTQHQQLFTQLVQAREREVDFLLGNPDKATFIAQFDARAGQPGAFKAEVVRRGNMYFAQGTDVSAEQAVTETLRLAGFVPGQVQPQVTTVPAGQAGATPQQQAGAGQAQGQQAKPPVIRNMGGSGQSPAKRVIKSREDLKARRAELLQQGR